MKSLILKIFILIAAALLFSCEALPFNYSVNKSWLIDSTALQEKTRITILDVQIDRSGGWDSVEREAASLAPLYFWDEGCLIVSAEEGPQFAANILIRERDFTIGWKSKKSLTVEVRIWPFRDTPVSVESYEDQKLPAAVGRVVMTGDASFSSSAILGKLLSKAIKQAIKKLASYKG